jgi:hypothetical protein
MDVKLTRPPKPLRAPALAALLGLALVGLPSLALSNTTPTPTGVQLTKDNSLCLQHGGDLACAKLQTAGYTAIVWNGETAANRYEVYRTYKQGPPLEIGIVQYNSDPVPVVPTFFMLASVTPGACYAVSEYKQGETSARSIPWCVHDSFKVRPIP